MKENKNDGWFEHFDLFDISLGEVSKHLKQLGQVALHSLFDLIHHEPLSSQSEHYPLDEGLEDRTYEP